MHESSALITGGLVTLFVLILILALVLSLIAVVLTILIAVLLFHIYTSKWILFAFYRKDSIPRFLGFILGTEKKAGK